MEAFLDSEQGVWLCVGAALIGGLLFVFGRNLVMKERKHMNQLAGALNDAGAPSWFTEAISDLAVGDVASAVGAAVKAAERLKTPAGQAEFATGVFTKIASDPNRKAAATKMATDFLAGAAPETLAADLQGAWSANPLSKVVGTGPIATDFTHAVDIATAIKNNPGLAGVLGALDNVPAQVKAGLAKLLGTSPAAAPPASGAPVPVTTTNPAPAPASTPAAQPSGGAVSAAGASSIPDGHLAVNVVLPPGATLPAVSNPAAPAGAPA